ncbi:DUF6694 family lipoprotein [Pseudomonas putida]|uniref:Lipoprotein n=1 Tax=Pseudomonas putida TaxID=303 RepID=A0A6S5TY19_PSEPU|nr:DUF6694 family lipoprotein [Pseudomonas putida]BBT41402.1 hypothetical protein WP8W18C01_37430 [Pseudomonas putida]
MRRFIVLALTVGLLTGCGEPKVDGTSEESFKGSLSKMAENLPSDQREKLQSDLMFLAFQDVDIGKVLKGETNADDVSAAVYASLNGMTAKEISAKADAVRAERAERERKQAIAEIEELSNRKAQAAVVKSNLEKFEIQKSRFFKERQEYSYRDKPVIEMTVSNGTGQAVARAYFKGTIATPGRSVPWLVKEFNYEISGGLEPGEKQSWRLAPNQFSEWGNVEPPKDAVFTVEVERLDGADGKPLFGGATFNDRDESRLSSLREKYPN